MAGATCGRCGGPREFDSPSISYCKACGRAYQRERYRVNQAAMGRVVATRVPGTDGTHAPTPPTGQMLQMRQIFKMLISNNQTGHCSYCGILTEPQSLLPVYQIQSQPPTRVPGTPSKRRPYKKVWDTIIGVACQPCKDTAEMITAVGPQIAGAILRQLIAEAAPPVPERSYEDDSNNPNTPEH